MPPSKSPIRLEAEKLVLLMPKASTRSIATRLAKEFKCNYENARSAVRISRGEHIQKHKHTAVISTSSAAVTTLGLTNFLVSRTSEKVTGANFTASGTTVAVAYTDANNYYSTSANNYNRV